MPSHPFLDSAFEPRWSQLTPEHIAPDIELALTRAQAAIDTIARPQVQLWQMRMCIADRYLRGGVFGMPAVLNAIRMLAGNMP